MGPSSLSPPERVRFLLPRYVNEGFLAFVVSRGKYDESLEGMIIEVRESIDMDAPDAVEKTQRAIFAIKSKGVP